MKSTAKKGPVRVEGGSFADMLAKAASDAEKEAERVRRMTPEQKMAYAVKMEKTNKEVEKALKQLRGPGFMALHISAERKA